jgi:hypothetical protein
MLSHNIIRITEYFTGKSAYSIRAYSSIWLPEPCEQDQLLARVVLSASTIGAGISIDGSRIAAVCKVAFRFAIAVQTGIQVSQSGDEDGDSPICSASAKQMRAWRPCLK